MKTYVPVLCLAVNFGASQAILRAKKSKKSTTTTPKACTTGKKNCTPKKVLDPQDVFNSYKYTQDLAIPLALYNDRDMGNSGVPKWDVALQQHEQQVLPPPRRRQPRLPEDDSVGIRRSQPTGAFR